MESILITGHGGFIGSHLVENLSKNHNIIGIGKTRLKNTKIIQINQDIAKIKPEKIPKKISAIIHLAAITDIKFCQDNPQKCFKVNVQGTQNLLEICRKRNLKFIFLSTSHVFGKPIKIPINESHPKRPESAYACSKLCAESICEFYAKSYNLDISIIRLFSIYGPRSPDHLVTSKIISQALKNKVIKIGNLNSKRDFLYIDDAVSAISLVLQKTQKFDTYNVGYGKSHSIQELLNTVREISKTRAKISQDKLLIRKTDVPEVIADSSKIRKLGWTPKTNFYEGIRLTYDWYKGNTVNNKNINSIKF